MTATDSGSDLGLGLGALAARAHALLDAHGRPMAADRLALHVFGLTGMHKEKIGFWLGQLARVLSPHDLFTQGTDGTWGLAVWARSTESLRGLCYVVVDVETTGLSPRTHSLIEIGALRCRGTDVVETFTTLVDPGRPISAFIRRFTGIDDEMVAGAPSPGQAIEAFLRFAGDDVLVGHNVRFDLNFLGEAAQRHLGTAIVNESLDTIAVGRLLFPRLGRPSLDRLAETLGLSAPTRHRALADAELTAHAFWQLIERAEGQGIGSLERLRGALGLTGGEGRARRVSARRAGQRLLDPALRAGLPDTPGVYLMKDEHGEIIYVGKAKNLRARVSSYYNQPAGYKRKIDGHLEAVRELETICTGSELQALILENQLIKRHMPRYNVQQRSYAQYPFIRVDVQNAFPRVSGTREIAADGARYFGPYRSGTAVRTMVDLVQRLFPIRTCTRQLFLDEESGAIRAGRSGSGRGKGKKEGVHGSPCLRYSLGRCLGPCHGAVAPARYRETVDAVCGFLGGTGDELLARVEAEMNRAAERLRFEQAAVLRDLLRQARRVLVSQQLLAGAIERHNLLIVYPSSEAGHAEVFGVRHGRLHEQLRLDARRPLRELQAELRALCLRLLASREPPTLIGREEVDSINIIARWIYRHSDERSFISLHERHVPTVVQALEAVRACREQ